MIVYPSLVPTLWQRAYFSGKKNKKKIKGQRDWQFWVGARKSSSSSELVLAGVEAPEGDATLLGHNSLIPHNLAHETSPSIAEHPNERGVHDHTKVPSLLILFNADSLSPCFSAGSGCGADSPSVHNSGHFRGQEWHWGWPHIQTRMGLLLPAPHRWADELC